MDLKRSQYDENNKNEGKSIRFFEGVIEENGWKYRRQEKDNDIDGEIETFSENGETTAKVIKVQLKATTLLELNKDLVVFDCPVKFLNFCDVCDIPIIIVVYGVEEKKAYWLWTQKYILQTLENNNPKWRENTSSVRIKIPITNEVLEHERFYSEIDRISIEGINEIQQWRKQDTSEYYYTILEEKDNSTLSKRRINAKIYIERSLASSKDAMIELIKKINEKVKSNNYNKGVLEGKKITLEPDYVWLYFYDDLIQIEHGLPFCRTEWLDKKKNNAPILLKEYDQLISDFNIRVKWEYNRPLQKYLITNSHSKNQYLEDVRGALNFAIEELELLPKYFSEKDKDIFYNHINEKRKEYTSNYLVLSDLLPPYECRTLQGELHNALCDLDNLAIAIENKQGNEYYLNSQYVSKFFSHLITLRSEIKKII
ncbi:uncharacterized protein DUF4365 [Scopulibacillus darangshiensis]|uniref:Uncharacterized protein DUF4365 n=1 Tax=Scopulibacillus darangshiensis TaxID=442528 RepID=A0A4R2P247_9BACL|nr:DUF4365 domain-containing protein [Scopulibacillus darangshiensis]TCP28783.1 uncharacterized protein DUF4365 [Scopulibacillus darangshiensis]